MFGELTNPWWVFILLGIITGIASGLLGIGGGVIIVPALVIILAAFDQKTAQGTALAVMIPIVIVGTLRYMHNPDVTINWAVVILIAIGAVAGVLLGTTLVSHLPVGFLRKCFAVLMLLVAFKMFVSKPPQSTAETTDAQTTTTQTPENP